MDNNTLDLETTRAITAARDCLTKQQARYQALADKQAESPTARADAAVNSDTARAIANLIAHIDELRALWED